MPGTIPPNLDLDGYSILRGLCDDTILSLFDEAFSTSTLQTSKYSRKRSDDSFAMRNILRLPTVVSALRKFTRLCEVLKESIPIPAAVRGIYFDKPFRANWSVPWHQDLTIAVEKQFDLPGFANWTQKAGVIHVQPPNEILENMVTARIHLDDADETNGALSIIPGSHKNGHLPTKAVQGVVEKEKSVRCDVNRGDVMLMKPLLLHSSKSSESDRRRRVIHIEFCGVALPHPLRWKDQIGLP